MEWVDEHPNAKTSLMLYGIGAGLCLLVYGWRGGTTALRQFHIDKKKDNRVEAKDKTDRVLYGSLYGVGRGIVPSFFWPAHLGAFGMVMLMDKRIEAQVKKELEEADK